MDGTGGSRCRLSGSELLKSHALETAYRGVSLPTPHVYPMLVANGTYHDHPPGGAKLDVTTAQPSARRLSDALVRACGEVSSIRTYRKDNHDHRTDQR